MADYLDDLVETVSKFSLQLLNNNTTSMDNKSFPAHPYGDWDRGKRFKRAANLVINNFIQKWMRKSQSNVYGSQSDTLIFPLLQARPLGITQDEEVTSRIFENVPEGSMSYLTTGYFNLTAGYLKRILRAKGRYNILCAHPQANGFYKAGGIIGKLTSS